MKRKFNLFNFLLSLLMVMFVGVVAATTFGANPYIVAASLLTASCIFGLKRHPSKGYAYMAITTEFWQNHIEEEIFADNSFLRFSKSADDAVLNNRAVHIPQSGGSGNVVKNRTALPANIRKRTDTDVIYLLDEFTTDPVLIPNADTKELSYDKMNSVLGEDMDNLKEVIAESTLDKWVSSGVYGSYVATGLPSAHIFQVSGTNGVLNAEAASATGNRKIATLKDLQRLQAYFRTINRWKEGKMYIMLPPTMLTELFPADSVITATYMQNVTENERRLGIMFKAQGFNIMSRSSVLRTQSDGTLRVQGEAGAAGDHAAALAWYSESVEFAMGGVEAFENLGDPTMYGDVYSFLARTGGRAVREDYKGIAVLRQTETA
ncbi:MAG: hypothetical protein RIC03_06955 [Cyclobacteriaceae bacterium]